MPNHTPDFVSETRFVPKTNNIHQPLHSIKGLPGCYCLLSNPHETSEPPCECCGSLKFTPVHLRENNTLVVHCDECHLEFVNPLPTVESMQKNYQKEMTGDETESGLHSSYILERQARIKSFSKLYNSRLSFIERLYSGKGNLLDIGCGAGFFLNCAKERGWNCHGLRVCRYHGFLVSHGSATHQRQRRADHQCSRLYQYRVT